MISHFREAHNGKIAYANGVRAQFGLGSIIQPSPSPSEFERFIKDGPTTSPPQEAGGLIVDEGWNEAIRDLGQRVGTSPLEVVGVLQEPDPEIEKDARWRKALADFDAIAVRAMACTTKK